MKGSRSGRRRGFVTSICAFLVAAILTNCAPSGGQVAVPTATAADEIRAGFLLSSLSGNAFYVSLAKGAVEAASRLNVQLIVRDAGADADRQNKQIEELLAVGVDAVIIQAVDSVAVVSAVKAVDAAGVPIFTVERRVKSPAVVSHVSPDYVVGGEMAATHVAETLDGKGTVAELVGLAGTSAAQDRSSGFSRVLGTYPNIEIVAREVSRFDRHQGQRLFAQILEQHLRLDALFAHNDEMILGAIEAAQKAGRSNEIIFVGFDAVPEAVEALENGRLTATIAQQPAEMGRLSVETAVRYLRGEPVPEYVTVDLALISR